MRLTEVASDHIRVKTEDWGAIDAPVDQYVVPLPAPHTLRPLDWASHTRPVTRPLV